MLKKKILYLIPFLTGAGVTQLIISLSNSWQGNQLLSPIVESERKIIIGESQRAIPQQSLASYLLQSQALINKAFEVSKNNPQDEKITRLVQESLATASQAIKDYPQESLSWNKRAEIYFLIRDSIPQALDLAINDWQKALTLNQGNLKYLKSLTNAWLEKKDLQKAVFCLKKITDQDPTDLQAIKALARYQSQLGQLAQAKKSYLVLLSLLINENEKTEIAKEIRAIDQLLSRTASEENGSSRDTNDNPREEIILPEAPLLEAKDLAQQVIIAEPRDLIGQSQTDITSNNSLSGDGIIKSGQTEVMICNQNLSSESKIYLAAKEETEKEIVFIKKKDPSGTNEQCRYFVAAIKQPLGHDFSFKWWIVN